MTETDNLIQSTNERVLALLSAMNSGWEPDIFRPDEPALVRSRGPLPMEEVVARRLWNREFAKAVKLNRGDLVTVRRREQIWEEGRQLWRDHAVPSRDAVE